MRRVSGDALTMRAGYMQGGRGVIGLWSYGRGAARVPCPGVRARVGCCWWWRRAPFQRLASSRTADGSSVWRSSAAREIVSAVFRPRAIKMYQWVVKAPSAHITGSDSMSVTVER